MSVSDIQKQQAEIWNGQMGENWAETQKLTDEMLESTVEHLTREVVARNAEHVLDIGCGNGATTAAMADAQNADGKSVGIDLSRAMIANAKDLWSSAYGNKVSFIADDAATHDYGAARFDHFSSRFGTMFFADQRAAFSHLRGFASDQASMYLITWRGPEENSFLTSGPRVVASVLGPPPPANPDAPSPFAMSNPQTVEGMLSESGWTSIEFERLDLEFGFPAVEVDTFMKKLAPLGPRVGQSDPATQVDIFDRVRSEYSKSIQGERLVYAAACWAIRAQAA